MRSEVQNMNSTLWFCVSFMNFVWLCWSVTDFFSRYFCSQRMILPEFWWLTLISNSGMKGKSFGWNSIWFSCPSCEGGFVSFDLLNRRTRSIFPHDRCWISAPDQRLLVSLFALTLQSFMITCPYLSSHLGWVMNMLVWLFSTRFIKKVKVRRGAELRIL